MISLKRFLQHSQRKATSLLRSGSTKSVHIQAIQEQLNYPVPAPFTKALFNFTIDFEIVWGNGLVDQKEITTENRIRSAEIQAKNFEPFMNMLKKMDFPITWAVLGKLADTNHNPSPELAFRPAWAQRDWYDPRYKELEPNLWNGADYLNKIKTFGHETLSHGYAHIDYADPNTTQDIARWDMKIGIETLRNFGFPVNGFVFPCNKMAFQTLLKENGISIARGIANSWQIERDYILSPKGFWISPAFFTVNEIKSLLDYCVQRKSFFHPWMHLTECDLNQNDIENFYQPIFSYVKELELEGKLNNISFSEIAKTINKNLNR